MTLIWAEGTAGDEALAPLWRRYATAEARSLDETLSDGEYAAAAVEARAARRLYDQGVAVADARLRAAAAHGEARTHAIVIGVGRYDDSGIEPLTTSVHGATAFAQWLLTRFRHRDHPLGSLELLLSPTAGLGAWQPSAAEMLLGLRTGDDLPVEAATFSNIREGFKRWLARASASPDNSAFFYFAGHGVWKSAPLLLPQDAHIPTTRQSPENLIDIAQTKENMLNTQPALQCFFVDACQEIDSRLIENTDSVPGRPLHSPTNASIVRGRDAWLYLGSGAGLTAYGPKDAPPFFTQELMTCLERRAAAGALDEDTWIVNSSSLGEALKAAAPWRAELEQSQELQFKAIGDSVRSRVVCHIKGLPEVFVQISCVPDTAMAKARLYVEAGGLKNPRRSLLASDWFTTVPAGDCSAGAEFDKSTRFRAAVRQFRAFPPLSEVELRAEP